MSPWMKRNPFVYFLILSLALAAFYTILGLNQMRWEIQHDPERTNPGPNEEMIGAVRSGRGLSLRDAAGPGSSES